MDTQKLLRAIENNDDFDTNMLYGFTFDKMREMTLRILKELRLSKKETATLYEKLKDYKYVDDMTDLRYGTYLRWIPIADKTELTRGAFFCEMKIKDDGVYCVCKNRDIPSRYFQIALDKNLIFQKLSEQEWIILSALSSVTKT